MYNTHCSPQPKCPLVLTLHARSVLLLHIASSYNIHKSSIETKNTYHRADPSFTYLLAFFMLLTGIAWGIAYAPSLASAVRLPLIFVFVHFLAISVLVATAAFFLVGRLLGPGIAGLPGRRRQQGLFTPVGEGESLEFGYCFDVSRNSISNRVRYFPRKR